MKKRKISRSAPVYTVEQTDDTVKLKTALTRTTNARNRLRQELEETRQELALAKQLLEKQEYERNELREQIPKLEYGTIEVVRRSERYLSQGYIYQANTIRNRAKARIEFLLK
jgi:anthranilate/para-aminobenzoate synthase component I